MPEPTLVELLDAWQSVYTSMVQSGQMGEAKHMWQLGKIEEAIHELAPGIRGIANIQEAIKGKE